jgi:hypothetical protein
VTNVTHDANNLLSVVMAYSELIQMDTTDSETNRMLSEMITAVERTSILFSSLTTISGSNHPDALSVTNISTVLKAIE